MSTASTATGVIDGARFQAELRKEEQQAWTAFFEAHNLHLHEISWFEVKENGDVEVHVLHRNAEGRLHPEGHCDLNDDGVLFLQTMRGEDGELVHPPCSCGREPSSLHEDEFVDPYSHDPCTNTVVIKAIG